MALNTDILEGNIFAGADIQLDFLIKDASDIPQTMTGWNLEFVVRASPNAGTALISKASGAGITVSNGSGINDVASVVITRADTLSRFPAKYWYTLWRSDSGFEIPLAYGIFVISSVAKQAIP